MKGWQKKSCPSIDGLKTQSAIKVFITCLRFIIEISYQFTFTENLKNFHYLRNSGNGKDTPCTFFWGRLPHKRGLDVIRMVKNVTGNCEK